MMSLPLKDGERNQRDASPGYSFLKADPQLAYDGIVRLAAAVCGTPVAAVILIPGEDLEEKRAITTGQTFLDSAFYARTITQPGLMIIADASIHPDFKDDPLVTGDAHLRFYAGIPLSGSDGRLQGLLYVMDTVPRQLSTQQQKSLVVLARQALEQIDLQQSRAIFSDLEAARNRAEEEMQESEVRLRVITDALPTLIAYVDSNQCYRFANAANELWFQRPREEITGKTMREVLGEAQYQAELPYIEAALAGQQAGYEREMTWPDGTSRFVKGTYVPRKGPAERVVGFAILVADLTDRNRIDRLLNESQQRYRSLFHHHPDAVHSFNLAYEFVSANDSCERVSGFTPDELVGSHFLPLVVPEDVERVLQHFAAAAEGHPQQFETAVMHKHGHRVEIGVTQVPIVIAGEVIGVYGIAQDITPRKQAEAERERTGEVLRQQEEQLRAVFDQAMDGIFLFDPKTGKILTTNAALQEMLGYTEEEATLLTLTEFTAPENHGGHEMTMQDVGSLLGERRVRCKDGTILPVEIRARVIRYGDGEAFCAIVHDITERKALETERERALQEALDRADKDPLTGLLNHRAFHRKLEEEAARAQREKTTLAVVMLDLDNFKFFNDVYGHATGDHVLCLVAAKLKTVCRPYDTLARFGGDEFALLLPGVGPATAGEVEARLRADFHGLFYRANEHDAAVPISVSLGSTLFPEASADRHEVLRQADERLRWSKTGGDVEENAQRVRADASIRVHGFPMLDALVSAVDNKDRYTRRHSEDVMDYSLLIARELALGEENEQTIAVAALLHDVGKIGVPDAILRKPGKLTEQEFEAIKQHPQMGAIIVQAVPGLEDALDAVRHHHERWDGQGYPFGLRGAETPLPARLMAVADAFSAMTTDRPYRQGMDSAEALAILEAGAGTQWDPQCVEAFVRTQRLRNIRQ